MLQEPCFFQSLVLKCTKYPKWTESEYLTFSTFPSKIRLCWTILVIVCFPQLVNSLPYKVGVVGPWTCDPLFSKAHPHVAAKLAIERISRDASLDLGLSFNYVMLNEDCQTSKALSTFLTYSTAASGFIGPSNPGYCDAATLLGKNWNKAVFSWACINYELDNVKSYPTFARTLPSPTRVLFNVMKYFQWAHVGVISSNEDIWKDTGRKVANALRNNGLPVGIVVSMGEDGRSTRQVLEKVRRVDNLRLIIMCMHSVLIGGQPQRQLLEIAHDMKMTDGTYVFIPYDTLYYSLPYHKTPYEILRISSKLSAAYDAVLTITVESEQKNFYQAFQEAIDSGEVISKANPTEVSPLFGTIYNAIYFTAHAMNNSRRHDNWVSGSNLVKHSKNMQFYGFNQWIRTDLNGNGYTDYVILDTDVKTSELHRTYVVDMERDMVRYMGRPIHFPNGVSPKLDSYCWFANEKICTGDKNKVVPQDTMASGYNIFNLQWSFLGDRKLKLDSTYNASDSNPTNQHGHFSGIQPAIALMVFLCILVAIISINGLAYIIRRRINKIKLVRGPNKILLTLNDVTFINPQISTKKTSSDGSRTSDSGHVILDNKSMRSPMRSSSAKSLTPATYENSNVAVYEGDWVWMKKCPPGDYGELKPGTSDVFEMMKDMRHENVNPFLGFFHDCGVFAIVTEFCTRGSLEDLLRNEDVKLDWMFKSSLLLDLIKGMKYLHHRKFAHGRLKSRNCVVDGRFVLKITDYGYNEVLQAQRIAHEEPTALELLWTAPELLRDIDGTLHGTFTGDVYSFSIIMQEVVVRGPPFCTLELTPEEIIPKIKKPPPLCRPVVSPDHAPMECIVLMKQCWNEVPDRRPTFDEIFDQVLNPQPSALKAKTLTIQPQSSTLINFKNINKGKKTNIIDSMLRMLEQYSSNLEDLIRERTEELEIEKQKTEKLLTQMLPPSVAEALKMGCTVEPEGFDEVTLYFSDIVGFTTISAMSEPIEVIDLLNDLYTLFDAVIGNHDVYKVETIGDAYMVASGLPKRNGNRHTAEIANMSLDILSSVGTFKMRHMPDVPVRIRIGLHSGSVVAGVVGLTMPRYCLFGDTVNTASRMESTGLPYRIHVNQSTVKTLRSLKEGYILELRGRTELKGKGIEETYWLVGKEGFTKPLPVPPVIKSGDEAAFRDLKRLLKTAVKKITQVRQITSFMTPETESG